MTPACPTRFLPGCKSENRHEVPPPLSRRPGSFPEPRKQVGLNVMPGLVQRPHRRHGAALPVGSLETRQNHGAAPIAGETPRPRRKNPPRTRNPGCGPDDRNVSSRRPEAHGDREARLAPDPGRDRLQAGVFRPCPASAVRTRPFPIIPRDAVRATGGKLLAPARCTDAVTTIRSGTRQMRFSRGSESGLVASATSGCSSAMRLREAGMTITGIGNWPTFCRCPMPRSTVTGASGPPAPANVSGRPFAVPAHPAS